MSKELREAMEVKVCEKCKSEEIDMVNSFSERITIDCRKCGHVQVIFDAEK